MSYSPPSAKWLGEDGLWVPKGWGRRWYAKRALHATSPVTVLVYGHSNAAGLYSSNLRTAGWAGKLGTDLQAKYSDGGSGFLSVENAVGIGPAGAMYITVTAGSIASNALATINERAVQLNASGQLTIPDVRGTDLDFWHVETTTADVRYSRNIGGAGAVDIQTGGKAAVRLCTTPTTVSGLSAAAKSVVLTQVFGTPVLVGVNGRNASGVVLHNMSQSGRTSQAGNVTTYLTAAPASTSRKVTITDFAPDLFIFSVGGGNDVGAATSTDNFLSSSSRILQAAKEGNKDCEIIIVNDHFGALGTEGEAASTGATVGHPGRFSGAMHTLARTFDAVVLDLWAMGHNSWDYWNDLGYWGITNGSTGAAGTDDLHPSDAGHAAIAARLMEVAAA